MQTGDKLKEIRKEYGLTQAELAKLSGISIASYQRYERGERNPKIDTLNKIATSLNISIRRLIGFEFDDADFKRFKENHADFTEGEELKQLFHGIFMSDQEENLMQIYNIFDCLNEIGQKVAIERLEELAEIPKYKRISSE